jgi:predicted GIY-YIG superfamily endonuclease
VFNSDLHVVRPGYHTPPHLEGRTALYILRQAGRFYVGETDAIRQRLERHRARLERVSVPTSSSSSGAAGVMPARVEALVLAAANKSAARALGKEFCAAIVLCSSLCLSSALQLVHDIV